MFAAPWPGPDQKDRGNQQRQRHRRIHRRPWRNIPFHVADRTEGCLSKTEVRYHNGIWPKAIVTVAWGTAPGLDRQHDLLAEGHIQGGGNEYGLRLND